MDDDRRPIPPPPRTQSDPPDTSHDRKDPLPPGPLRSPRKNSPALLEQVDLPSFSIANDSLRTVLAMNAPKLRNSTPSPLLRDGNMPSLNLTGLASGRQSPTSSVASCSPRGFEHTRRPSGGIGMIPPYLKSSSGSAHNLLEQADIPSHESQNGDLSALFQKFGSPSSVCSHSVGSTKTSSPLVLDQDIDRIKRSPTKSDGAVLVSSPLISEHITTPHYVQKASVKTSIAAGFNARAELPSSFAVSASGGDSPLKDPKRSKKIKESMNILRDHA